VNLIGDSRSDYVCPSFASGGCNNDLRVKRDPLHRAVWDRLKADLLSQDAIARGKVLVRDWLREQARRAEAAAREAEGGAEFQRLDAQIGALRALKLPPAALSAALASIERERVELRERATPRRSAQAIQAEDFTERVVAKVRKKIEVGVHALADPKAVAAAREATRRLLRDGTIVLRPTPNHDALCGVVRFIDLGEHLLEQVGGRRAARFNGSGGRIWDVPSVARSVRVK